MTWVDLDASLNSCTLSSVPLIIRGKKKKKKKKIKKNIVFIFKLNTVAFIQLTSNGILAVSGTGS